MSGQRGRLDNKSTHELCIEVDEKLFQLKSRVLNRFIADYNLKNVFVDLLKGTISNFLGTPFSLIEYLGRLPDATEQRTYTFIAKAHLSQEQAIRQRK